jgi:hypothetical protein
MLVSALLLPGPTGTSAKIDSQFNQNTLVWVFFYGKNKVTAYISRKYLYGKYTNYCSGSQSAKEHN